ncbi:MAG: chordopoxvirus fusion protein [Chloroflexi bacterium]|nr:MAG: chordopoxvirus fusion protein [Chloroflexota bacterium]
MTVVERLKLRLAEAFEERQAAILAEVITEAYDSLVKVSDFNELKEIVRDLAEAQRDLAEAQRASEARLTRLEETVAELAEAQQKTEARLDALAEAQRRTEESLQKLIEEHQETRRQLGGLAMAVGYGLENQAYRALPRLLARDFGIEVQGRLLRRYVKDREGRDIEVNIIGEAIRDGERIVIVGEGKSQLSKNGVDDFVRKKLKRLEGVLGPIFPVLVTHMISSPDVEEYVRERGIALYYSYDF